MVSPLFHGQCTGSVSMLLTSLRRVFFVDWKLNPLFIHGLDLSAQYSYGLEWAEPRKQSRSLLPWF